MIKTFHWYYNKCVNGQIEYFTRLSVRNEVL